MGLFPLHSSCGNFYLLRAKVRSLLSAVQWAMSCMLAAYSFYTNISVQPVHPHKKILYLSLVKSRIIYATQVWRPHKRSPMICYQIQLQNPTTNLASFLWSSSLSCPLKSDIIFYVTSYKNPQDHFDISSQVRFTSPITTPSRLLQQTCLWNCLPPLDLDSFFATIKKCKNHLLV